MLTVVVPAASASAFKRPSFLNDVSHRAAAAETHGFLPNKTRLFLSRSSTADLTTAAGRLTLAASVPTWSSIDDPPASSPLSAFKAKSLVTAKV